MEFALQTVANYLMPFYKKGHRTGFNTNNCPKCKSDRRSERSTTTQPPITGPRPETCTQCFDMLNATQQQAINQTLAGDPNILESIVWPAGITTLEELCKAWDQFTSAQRSDALADIGSLIQQTPLDSATRHKLFTCFVVSAGQ